MSNESVTVANSPLMRLIALLLAVGVGILAWWVFRDAETETAAQNAPVIQPQKLDAMGTPESVTRCIDERTAEIDQWLEEGLMDEASATLSKNRARTTCMARNS